MSDRKQCYMDGDKNRLACVLRRFNSLFWTPQAVPLTRREGFSLLLRFEFLLLPFHMTNPNVSGSQGFSYLLSSCCQDRGPSQSPGGGSSGGAVVRAAGLAAWGASAQVQSPGSWAGFRMWFQYLVTTASSASALPEPCEQSEKCQCADLNVEPLGRGCLAACSLPGDVLFWKAPAKEPVNICSFSFRSFCPQPQMLRATEIPILVSRERCLRWCHSQATVSA